MCGKTGFSASRTFVLLRYRTDQYRYRNEDQRAQSRIPAYIRTGYFAQKSR